MKRQPARRRARRMTQALLGGATLVILFATTYPVPERGMDILPRLSPLLAAASTLAGGAILKFWPAIILVISAILAGRVFCGWACPLGALIDLSDSLLRRISFLRRILDEHRVLEKFPLLRETKFALLLFSLVAAFFGFGIAGWLDPLSVTPRTVATFLFPLADIALEEAMRLPLLGGAASLLDDALRGRFLPIEGSFLTGSFGVAAMLVFILAASLLGSRGWCSVFCPLGAMLGLIGAKAPYRRRVLTATCSNCDFCVDRCPTGAINLGGNASAEVECVFCLNCSEVCPTKAVSYSIPEEEFLAAETALPRRAILGGIGLSVIGAPALALDRRGERRFIRPPGARKEHDFLAACIRCGECMKVCPTSVLKPVTMAGGLSALWTPQLVPRLAWCEYSCHDCAKVCPTEALERLAIPEKQRTIIGLAIVDKEICLPWHEGVECVVCEEFCPTPTKAIQLNKEKVTTPDGETLEVAAPHVVNEECIGCGICETQCPVKGKAAIRVEPVAAQLLVEKG